MTETVKRQRVRLRERLDSDEADRLLMQVLGVNRAWLFAHDDALLSATHAAQIDALAARRASGEPLAYVLGEQDFYGRVFEVNPTVLIPRPDTECLVDAALARGNGGLWLDLGTGSGAIAVTLALERSDWQVFACDRSALALRVAQKNARRLSAPVKFWCGDWLEAVAPSSVDGIVANPPYLAPDDPHLPSLQHEPRSALVAGSDGLRDLRAIACAALVALKPGGWLMLEHGFAQGGAAREILRGYADVQTLLDLERRERVTMGRRPW